MRDANLGFVGKLVRSLRSPGGFVVANLWNSEDRVEFSRERRELEEFRAQLSSGWGEFAGGREGAGAGR